MTPRSNGRRCAALSSYELGGGSILFSGHFRPPDIAS